MTPLDKLSQRQQAILRIIDERQGASIEFMQLRMQRDGQAVPVASIRRDIGTLRAAGYDITFGEQTSCDGRKLYGWVKSPIVPQPVVEEDVMGVEF